MIRSNPLRLLASASSLLALCSMSAAARAQATPLSEAIVIGSWTFRPSLEVRVRGEYRQHPVDTGGALYTTTAVLGESYGSTQPSVREVSPARTDQFYVSERSRLGLAVDRGPVTGVLTLQDARLLGNTQSLFTGAGQPALPSFAPYEAYVDVHTRAGRRVFLRLGRQRVVWGDGRLVGANDWSLTGRSLDAARFGVQLGDVDLEAMAVLLAAPGNAPPIAAGTQQTALGTGSQLYGLDASGTSSRSSRSRSPAWRASRGAGAVVARPGRHLRDRRPHLRRSPRLPLRDRGRLRARARRLVRRPPRPARPRPRRAPSASRRRSRGTSPSAPRSPTPPATTAIPPARRSASIPSSPTSTPTSGR